MLLFCLICPNVWATADLDRQYALQTIGYLKSWDNVDGLFADYVDQAYREYFSENTRYVLQDLSKANDILSHSKLPYSRIIEDKEILGQLSRSLRVESVLRSRIQKEGPVYRFQIEWLHSPKMDLIAAEAFEVREPKRGERMSISDIKKALRAGVDTLLGKVPFVGQVNGRDGDVVTVNLGKRAGLKRGDTLVIQTIDEVRKHPLLKTIVDWKLTPVGKLVVEDTDENLGFTRVLEENAGRKIGRFQKIIQIIPLAESPTPLVEKPVEPVSPEDYVPRIGWSSATLNIGAFSRQYSTGNGAGGFAGSGFYFGAKTDGNIWFTKEFFGDLGFGFGFSTYAQSDLATGESAANSPSSLTLFSMRAAAGYTLFLTENLFGPKGWVKMGYQNHSYSMTTLVAAQTGSINFGSIFMGIGADVPIRSGWGATLNFDFGLLNFVSNAAGLSAGYFSGPSSVGFFVGGYYRLQPRMIIRAGLDFLSHASSFSGGVSMSHRVITFAPSLVYYF